MSMLAPRHMHLYGTRREAFAEIAISYPRECARQALGAARDIMMESVRRTCQTAADLILWMRSSVPVAPFECADHVASIRLKGMMAPCGFPTV